MAYVQVKTKQRLRTNWQLGNGLAQRWVLPAGASCVSLGGCKVIPECKELKHKHAEGFPHADAVDFLTVPQVEGRGEHFWVFVLLEELRYWIVPDRVFRECLIRGPTMSHLRHHGGHRLGRVHKSLHGMIKEQQLHDWLGKWDELDLDLS